MSVKKNISKTMHPKGVNPEQKASHQNQSYQQRLQTLRKIRNMPRFPPTSSKYCWRKETKLLLPHGGDYLVSVK